MSKLIKIGIPSKGRLKDESLKFFKKNNVTIKDSKRNYLSEIKNFSLNEVVFSHAKEIVERLGDNFLDIGISGFDLLKESLPDIGKLRVATKYPKLTNDFLLSKNLTQYKIINSLGSTEIYPFTGQSEIITDITSTGTTLKANKLRILKDGDILKSSACILISKKSLRNKNKKKIILKLLNKLKNDILIK